LHICYIWETVNVQAEETEMVKGLKGSDLPEPWFGKKSKLVTVEKRTKPTSRGMPAEQAVEAETEGQCMNIGERGAEKVKKKKTLLQRGKTI
jgi:hypothetical protein